jgi:putative transposase
MSVEKVETLIIGGGQAGLAHRVRTHLSLDKDAPEPRLVERLEHGRIVETPMVGGLHHRYTRQAA